MDRVQCSFCERKFENSLLLKVHFKNDHIINLSKNDTEFICKTDNCMKPFKTSKGFFTHIDTMHYFSQNNETTEFTTAKETLCHSWNPKKLSIDGNITEMIADLKLSTNVTGLDFGRFLDSIEELLSDVMLRVTEKIKEFFEHKNMDILDPENKLFLNQFNIQQSFSNYKNLQGQIQMLKKNYNFIEAKEVHLGYHEEVKIDKKTGLEKTVFVEDSFQYVPLIDTLKLVLSNEEVSTYLQKDPVSSPDGIFTSYRDGENFKSNPFFQKHRKAVGIHLYYDDFLINNPIGTKTHAHKMGGYYYTERSIQSYRP